MKKPSFQTLQAGRGVAAIGVVFFHAGQYGGLDPRFWLDAPLAQHLGFGALGVQFFFILSGIVILLAHWRDQGHSGAVATYAWKRFRRIYPIYWIVLAVVAAMYFLNPSLGTGLERDPWVVLSSFLLFPIHTLDTVLHVAWTMYHEVMFYLVFALVIFNRRIGYTVLTLWMLASIADLCGLLPTPWLDEFFTPLHLLFGMGMLATWILKRYPAVPWKPLLIAGAVVLAYTLRWCWINGSPARGGQISVIAGTAFTLIILGLMELERLEHLRVWPWLVTLGDASYSIYLAHFPVLSIVFRLLYPMSFRIHLPLMLWLTTGVTMATLCGLLLHFTIERPLLAWLQQWDTPRKPATAAA